MEPRFEHNYSSRFRYTSYCSSTVQCASTVMHYYSSLRDRYSRKYPYNHIMRIALPSQQAHTTLPNPPLQILPSPTPQQSLLHRQTTTQTQTPARCICTSPSSYFPNITYHTCTKTPFQPLFPSSRIHAFFIQDFHHLPELWNHRITSPEHPSDVFFKRRCGEYLPI